MTNLGAITAATLLATGLLGGAYALRRPAPEAAPRPDAALEARVAKLEAELADARKDRDAALRQGAEAHETALDARREVDRLRERTDDLFAVLDGAFESKGGPAAGAAPPDGTLAAYTPPPAPAGDVESVKQALAQIKKEEDEKRRADREARQKEADQRRLQNLVQRLNLDQSQQLQVATVWEETRQRRQEIMAQPAGGPTPLADALRQLRTDEDAKLQAILTPEQYAEYQKSQQPAQGGRRGLRGGGGGGAAARQGQQPQPAATGATGATGDGPAR